MGDVHIPTTVELIQYNESQHIQQRLTLHDDLKSHIKAGFVNWFKITGISDVSYVSKVNKSFGLHTFDTRELLSTSNIVKIVLYNEVTFSLLHAYYLDENELMDHLQVAFIVGENFIVTFEESPKQIFDETVKAIAENDLILRRKEADYLLYVLLNSVNAFNNTLISNTEDYLWEIEDQLILQKESVGVLHALHKQKRNCMILKRFTSSLSEEFDNLLHNSNRLIKAENMVYFENLDDKYRTISHNIFNLEESVKSLLDLYYSNNAMKMNQIMKQLTSVATIFIPLTFLVGVWGMNFENMTELSWKYGYLLSWVLFVIIGVALFAVMKKKKWF